MKLSYFLFIFAPLMLFSCEEKLDQDRQVNTNQSVLTDNINTTSSKDVSDTIVPEVIVKNITGYSEEFIKGLKENRMYKKYTLKDSLMILDDMDTVYFPSELKIGESIILTGKRGDLAVALTLKRINYTTIDYKIEMVEFGKANYNASGHANILSMFFLGSEIDEGENGVAYTTTEYSSEKNGCYTAIRLGYEEGKSYLSAKLKKNCNDKIKDIELDNFPTLYEK